MRIVANELSDAGPAEFQHLLERVARHFAIGLKESPMPGRMRQDDGRREKAFLRWPVHARTTHSTEMAANTEKTMAANCT